MSGFFEKGESSQSATRDVTIPDFLKPLIGQGTSISRQALARINHMLTGPARDFVAGFTPDQQAAFERVREISGNLPGFDVLSSAAGGEGLSFLPESVRSGLSSLGGIDFLPQFTRDTLTSGGAPDDLETLQRTAGGDFLFGGEGFDQAVEAAVRAARPGILSTFGGAGVGGGTGALSQAAIGTAATDAFARQFAQERQNQLGAAESLARLGLAGRGQDIQAAGLLGGFAEGAEGRSLQGLGLLSGVSDAERARQLTAAGELPGLAFSGVQPLLNIGGLQQGLEQQRLNAPIDRQLQLLAAALGIPSAFSPLFGDTQTGESESRGFRLGF